MTDLIPKQAGAPATKGPAERETEGGRKDAFVLGRQLPSPPVKPALSCEAMEMEPTGLEGAGGGGDSVGGNWQRGGYVGSVGLVGVGRSCVCPHTPSSPQPAPTPTSLGDNRQEPFLPPHLLPGTSQAYISKI